MCVRVPARCASCSARLIVRWRPARARRWPRAALALAASALSVATLVGASSLVEVAGHREPARPFPVRGTLSFTEPEPVDEDDVEVCDHTAATAWLAPDADDPRRPVRCAVPVLDCLEPRCPSWCGHPKLRGARARLVTATHALGAMWWLDTSWRDRRLAPCRGGVTLAAVLLRLTERGGGCPCLERRVERALSWLPAQQRYGGSFPGDDLAQAQAARALGERGPLPGWAQPWLYGAAAPARALARALQRTPAERWSAPRTWRDLALDPRPGTLPLRLDPRRDDVRALVATLVATQHGDGTWTRVAGELKDERPELATAVNALLLACALFQPDGTLTRGRE